MWRNAAKCTLAFFGRRDFGEEGRSKRGSYLSSALRRLNDRALCTGGLLCIGSQLLPRLRLPQPSAAATTLRVAETLGTAAALRNTEVLSCWLAASVWIASDRSGLSFVTALWSQHVAACVRAAPKLSSPRSISHCCDESTLLDSVAEQGQAATAAAPLKTTEPLQSVECTEVVWHRDTSALSACEIPVALLGRLRWLGAIGITGAQVVCVLWPRCLSRSTILMHQWLDIVAAACAEPAR